MSSDRNSLIRQIREHSSPLEPRPTGLDALLPPLPEIRAVCFDVYGTLLISASGDIGLTLKEYRSATIAEALRETGFSIKGPSGDFADTFYNILRQHSDARRSEGIEFPEIRIDKVWQDFLALLQSGNRLSGHGDPHSAAIAYECRINPVWPMPGAAKLLHELAQRRVPLGIVSNAQFFTPLLFPALLHKNLSDLGFSSDLRIWSYEEQIGKPERSLYQLLAFRLSSLFDLQPHQCLYVGNDMRNDIAPAAASGFRTALFAGDERSLRLRKGDSLVGRTKPDVILTELNQLLTVLPSATE